MSKKIINQLFFQPFDENKTVAKLENIDHALVSSSTSNYRRLSLEEQGAIELKSTIFNHVVNSSKVNSQLVCDHVQEKLLEICTGAEKLVQHKMVLAIQSMVEYLIDKLIDIPNNVLTNGFINF